MSSRVPSSADVKRDEAWSVLDAVYFTVMTYLTIGLGDLVPDPDPWYFAIAWFFSTFVGLGFTTYVFSTFVVL